MDDVGLEPRECLVRREVGADDLGPALRRVGNDGPVRRAVVDDGEDLGHERQPVAPGERRVDAVEDAGLRVRLHADAGATLLAQRDHALAVPRRNEAERLGIGPLEARPLDAAVEEEGVDEERTSVVGAPGDRAHERHRRDVCGDGDDLAGLDVRARDDREVGELLEKDWLDPGRLLAAPLAVLPRQVPSAMNIRLNFWPRSPAY